MSEFTQFPIKRKAASEVASELRAAIGAAPATSQVPMFNVRDFGAEGDGVTDDRAAIQAALIAARDAGGGTVYLPKGTYVVATRSPSEVSTYKGSVRVYSGTTLMGEGPLRSIIKVGDNAPGNFPVLFAHSNSSEDITSDIVFRDFSIDGNRSRETSGGEDEAIDLSSTRRILFENLHIYEMGSDGIDLDDPISGAIDHTVRGCVFRNLRGIGIHGGGNNFRCYDSIFEECGRDRLDGYNPGLPRETRWITPNTDQSAAWDGCCADTRGGSGHVYDGCTFIGGGQGIKIGAGSVVRNCRFSGDFLNGVGIMVGASIEPTPGSDAPRAFIENCEFSSLMSAGIDIAERNKVQRGVWVRHGRATIRGCLFVLNGGAGVVIGDSVVNGSETPVGVPAGVIVSDCEFRQTGTDFTLSGGVRVDRGTNDATITGNLDTQTSTAMVTFRDSPTGRVVISRNRKFGTGRVVDVRVRADNTAILDNIYLNGTPNQIRFMTTGSSPNRGRDSIGCVITGNHGSHDFDTLSLSNNIVKNNIWDGEWVPDGRTNP
jgi:hypothetical protein